MKNRFRELSKGFLDKFRNDSTQQELRRAGRRWIVWISLFLNFILILGVILYFSWPKIIAFKQKNLSSSSETKDLDSSSKTLNNRSNDAYIISNGKCQGSDKPKLTHLPMREEDFSMILPYGMVVGNHVTPIDHQYFSPTDYNSKRDAYPVFAMADARLVDIGTRNTPRGEEYRLVFSQSCKLFYYYDLVTKLSPDLEQKRKERRVDVEIRAGQQIGWIGGQTLDFAVWDMDVKLTGFLDPEKYKAEAWKIHTADPLLYYTDELKAKALAKYIRTAEPISGKIDYDIDGKLIGNWFLEGTDGYMGGGKENYWRGHLSFAPDYLDPTSFVISVGDYAGKEIQAGAKGNSPNPVSVSKEFGIVKYELVENNWIKPDGSFWDRKSAIKGLKANNREDYVIGIVLVQMLENRKIKFEVFPEKTAAQVSNFTNNAKIYVR